MLKRNYDRSVFCRCEFTALHCWPEATEPVAFLRNLHRHVFKIECQAQVAHNNRDIEFITLKDSIQNLCNEQWAGRDIGCTSCEDIAETILDAFSELHSVIVSEDGENGAILRVAVRRQNDEV